MIPLIKKSPWELSQYIDSDEFLERRSEIVSKIDYYDLLVNFKLILENSLNEEQISEIVKKTISEYSSDQTYITYEEFLRVKLILFN